MSYKVIQVGTGGFGQVWCKSFLPPFIREGSIEVVAAVDIDSQALQNAHSSLGLPKDKCYTDIRAAFDENRADFCTIVVPPVCHEEVVDLALAHDMHIISEKPIADTLVASARIAEKIRRSGKKMAITMNHRFDQDKMTLREELHSERYGALNYLILRLTCDCRRFSSWGRFRHEMLDPLLIEGGIHHLDILADLAGATCETVYAQSWRPFWAQYAGDSHALVVLHFEGGTRAMYEGAMANAVGLNCWSKEYIRAECEYATLILNGRKLERFGYDPTGEWTERLEGQGEEIPLREQPKWAHLWLIEKFVNWLDGGEPMETNVEANLQAVAMIFAAVESSRSGQPVRVQDLLAKALRDV